MGLAKQQNANLFKEMNETARSTQLTIHQESTHNPQVQGHGFRKQEEGQKKEKQSQNVWEHKTIKEVLKDGSPKC